MLLRRSSLKKASRFYLTRSPPAASNFGSFEPSPKKSKPDCSSGGASADFVKADGAHGKTDGGAGAAGGAVAPFSGGGLDIDGGLGDDVTGVVTDGACDSGRGSRGGRSSRGGRASGSGTKRKA